MKKPRNYYVSGLFLVAQKEGFEPSAKMPTVQYLLVL